jgi:hypothetical protein
MPALFAAKHFPDRLEENYLRERKEWFSQAFPNGDAYGDINVFLRKKQNEYRVSGVDLEYLSSGPTISYPDTLSGGKHTIVLSDLAPKVYSESERDTLINLCRQEFQNRPPGHLDLANVIAEIVELCHLLQKPENFIETPTAQYTQNQHHTRTTHDMAGEMVQTLTSLPRYTAVVKRMEDTQSTKHIIKTRDPSTYGTVGDTFFFQIQR